VTTSNKPFRLAARQIESVAKGYGACIASDHITIAGEPVRFLYRQAPTHSADSGWHFFSGLEDEAYLDDPSNLDVYDVNTIANYDPSIIPLLDEPVGSVFEKLDHRFVAVLDWTPTEN
jgi:hypothetical protein